MTGYEAALDKVAYLHASANSPSNSEDTKYAHRATWSQENITEITQQNMQAATNKYKLELPPQRWNRQLGEKGIL